MKSLVLLGMLALLVVAGCSESAIVPDDTQDTQNNADVDLTDDQADEIVTSELDEELIEDKPVEIGSLM